MNINDKENLAIKINMLEQENAQLRAELDLLQSIRKAQGSSIIALRKDRDELKAEVEDLKTSPYALDTITKLEQSLATKEAKLKIAVELVEILLSNVRNDRLVSLYRKALEEIEKMDK